MNFSHFAIADFQSHDDLLSYKEEMIEHYSKQFGVHQGLSVLYSNELLEDDIGPRIKNIISETFEFDWWTDEIFFHIYVQDNKNYNSAWHCHLRGQPNLLDPSIVGCLYIDPPPTPSFEFAVTPELVQQIAVEKNKLYIFPSWLQHRPIPQDDPTTRISICWGVMSKNRPIYKQSNIIW